MVQKFVRWHPYNVDEEMIWRGNFFCFAVALLFIGLSPKRHASVLVFFAFHFPAHSLVMLIDNLRNLDGNGNPEHAGEVIIFMLGGISCVMGLVGLWKASAKCRGE
mmetsp:Transcript_33599/g.78794  ORF Transcript_33599/g.78794 Transcript_33599/m.78794 type:complete len:106 (-) Transcript_33599:226-543(-)